MSRVIWQWQDLDTKDWNEFNDDSQKKLEKSYKNKEKTSSLLFQTER